MSGVASKVTAWTRKYIGVAKRARRYISREERAELMAELRAMKARVLERRERHCDTPLSFPAEQDAVQVETFAGHHAKVCTRLERERRHAAVRDLNATAVYRAADWLFWNPKVTAVDCRRLDYTPDELRRISTRLMRARKQGHWGIHTETGKTVIRYFDRSGLPLLDPSEANRSAARVSRRMIPVLMRWARAGALLYYGVASEPNVPLGSLKWGKRHLFRRLQRTLRKAFPEIIGVLAVQEDPLGRDRQSWNVHVNVILVVDPKRCTRLTPATHRQLRLALGDSVVPLEAPLALDRTPRGHLSFAKIHAAWRGAIGHQFNLQPIAEANEAALAKTLRELIKYSAKQASKKTISAQLEESVASGFASALTGPLESASNPFELNGERPRGRGRPPALGLSEYPPAELLEYLNANRRFRRVRTWGVLYGIEDDDHEDADRAGKIRWCGRVWVSPTRASAEEAPLQFINSIHGLKSAPNSGSYIHPPALWQARAGPPGRAGTGIPP